MLFYSVFKRLIGKTGVLAPQHERCLHACVCVLNTVGRASAGLRVLILCPHPRCCCSCGCLARVVRAAGA